MDKKTGHVLAFAQHKGGSGKTTILTHLAHSWAKSGKSVGIIELDPRGSLSNWLKRNPDIHISVKPSNGWKISSNIHESRKRHDLTLIDCANPVDAALHSAVKNSDLVIIPCQPSGLDVWATETVLKVCRGKKTPAKVLLNRIHSEAQELGPILEELEKLGASVFATHIGNRIAFSAGMLDATSPVIRGTHTLANKTAHEEIEALRQEIDGIIEQL